MALGHVLADGGVAVSDRTAGMRSDALAALEQFNSVSCVARFQLLPGQLIRNAVIMPVDLDVIVDVGANGFPFRQVVAFSR